MGPIVAPRLAVRFPRVAPCLGEVRLRALFLDAIYLPVRPEGPKEGVLVAWGFTTHGERVLLDVCLGQRERTEDWTELGRGLIARGLRSPLLVVSDGAPGLVRAITELWPDADRGRCWAAMVTSSYSGSFFGGPIFGSFARFGAGRTASRSSRATARSSGCSALGRFVPVRPRDREAVHGRRHDAPGAAVPRLRDGTSAVEAHGDRVGGRQDRDGMKNPDTG